MQEEEKIKKLAETLIKSGLATCESMAIEKAREMLDMQEKTRIKTGIEIEEKAGSEKEDRTVDELMQEAGVDVEKGSMEENEGPIEEEKEETEEEKEALEEEQAEEEEGEEITIKEQAEEQEQPEEEPKKPTYEEEKSVDISEVFNYGRR